MIKCTYTSVWDNGTVIVTKAEYDPETGEVTAETSDSDPGDAALEREYILLHNGDEIDVCTTCHEYTTRKVVGDRADQSYGEYDECRNPECESHQ